MQETDNITKELKDLNSQLSNLEKRNPYSIPEGYFTSLPALVMSRIHNESNALSSLLPSAGENPYTVPEGYFDALPGQVLARIQSSGNASQEINELSPLLAGLKSKSTYTVPDAYFDRPVSKPTPAKLVKMGSRKIARYAAAAVITSLIVLAGFFYLNNNRTDPAKNSYAWVEKSVKKVSTENLDEFIDLVNTEKTVDSSTLSIVASQVKALVRDVPESEIESLLDDTEILDDPYTDELFLN